jgi:hypothetical protein
MLMTPRLRKLTLAAHVIFSVGWLGSVVAFLALASAGIARDDAQLVRATYIAMDLTGWYVVLPLCLVSLLTDLFRRSHNGFVPAILGAVQTRDDCSIHVDVAGPYATDYLCRGHRAKTTLSGADSTG